MCYVASLVIFQLNLALIQLDIHALGLSCTLAGFLLYYTVFMSVLWLNVMCFDIWQAFR